MSIEYFEGSKKKRRQEIPALAGFSLKLQVVASCLLDYKSIKHNVFGGLPRVFGFRDYISDSIQDTEVIFEVKERVSGAACIASAPVVSPQACFWTLIQHGCSIDGFYHQCTHSKVVVLTMQKTITCLQIEFVFSQDSVMQGCVLCEAKEPHRGKDGVALGAPVTSNIRTSSTSTTTTSGKKKKKKNARKSMTDSADVSGSTTSDATSNLDPPDTTSFATSDSKSVTIAVPIHEVAIISNSTAAATSATASSSEEKTSETSIAAPTKASYASMVGVARTAMSAPDQSTQRSATSTSAEVKDAKCIQSPAHDHVSPSTSRVVHKHSQERLASDQPFIEALSKKFPKYNQLVLTVEPDGAVVQKWLERFQPQSDSDEDFWIAFDKLLECVMELHQCDIIHADLKPEHLRESEQGVCVIDYNASSLVSNPRNLAYSHPYASIEQICARAVHFLDDYEAAIKIALSWRRERFIYPAGSSDSQPSLLAASVQYVQYVCRSVKSADSVKQSLYRRLLWLWDQPRAPTWSPPSWDMFVVSHERFSSSRNQKYTAIKRSELHGEGRLVTKAEVSPLCMTKWKADLTLEEQKAQDIGRGTELAIAENFYSYWRPTNEAWKVPAQSQNMYLLSENRSSVLTEFDIILDVEETKPYQVINQLKDQFPVVSAPEGIVIIWEDFTTGKGVKALARKLKILPEYSRPLHLLRQCQSLVLCGGDDVSDDKPQGDSTVRHDRVTLKSVTAEQLCELFLSSSKTDAWLLGVLAAAGRIVFCGQLTRQQLSKSVTNYAERAAIAETEIVRLKALLAEFTGKKS